MTFFIRLFTMLFNVKFVTLLIISFLTLFIVKFATLLIILPLLIICGMNVSIVTLFASACSYIIIWSIASLFFTLDNGVWCCSLHLGIVSYIYYQWFSCVFAFAMQARSYVASRLLKNFLQNSNSLKYPGALITSIF